MDTVLKRLKLQDLTEKFQTEHITPDIVCKLSVHEMEMLGINSRSDMMSLRIECTKFGGEAPKKLEGTCGAPIFFIPKSVLGDLLQEGFTIKKISSFTFTFTCSSTRQSPFLAYGCFCLGGLIHRKPF